MLQRFQHILVPLVEGGSKWRRGAAEFGGAGSVKVSEGQGRCRG